MGKLKQTKRFVSLNNKADSTSKQAAKELKFKIVTQEEQNKERIDAYSYLF